MWNNCLVGRSRRKEARSRGAKDASECSRQKGMTGYSGLFSWEHRGRGGVGLNVIVFHSHHKAAQKQISGFGFVTLANICSPLLYTFELNHKETPRRRSEQMPRTVFGVFDLCGAEPPAHSHF